MPNFAGVVSMLVALTLAQPSGDQSPSTAGKEFRAFIDMIASVQPHLNDFRCEFEGNIVIKSESVKQLLKLQEAGISQGFSGLFIWTTGGDTYVSTLHRIEPGGAIEREQLIVRRSKDEAEHYLRHDNAQLGRATLDRPSKVNTNREGCLGSIFLIDTLWRLSTLGGMVFSVTDEVLEGQKLKLLSISFAGASNPRHKLWIDLHRGGHFVRGESFAPGGELVGRANIELRSFPLGDKTIWMPVRGVLESHNAFKDGKPYYPSEPTSVETIYVVSGTMVFNKHPGPETFKITYKPSTPISDNLRKLEYEFGQQKVEPRSPMPKVEAEKMLNEAVAKAEEQRSELVAASPSEGFDWSSWLGWGSGVALVIGATILVIQRRRH